ncbi:uncharacterized protein TrAFT101_004665 [Trichoderma asperellum]|uniref:uncharacterized protein n=1 Tax=Trichoderma asperellum TaxID=101201 RepID=UPI003321C1BF|nr:hypothetical protein TrAFT101_004665 [Trichoderma asperellum]
MSSSENQSQAPGGQYFPPPPPGPPPPQQQQSQQPYPTFPPPPQQQQHQPYPTFPPPPQQPGSQSPQPPHDPHQQHQQTEQQQQFPPPPPLPQHPPHQEQQQQQQHPDFSQQHNQQQQNQTYNPQTYQPQPQPQQPSAYSIPAYNPANPVFAPPPSNAFNEPASPSAYQPPVEGQQQQQHQYQQQQHSPSPDSHLAYGDDHGNHKSGWSERLSALGMKAAAPINSIAHKLGSQSFLPETLDKECEKAATILRAFCKKGVYADPAGSSLPTSTDPNAAESTDRVIDPTREKPKNRVIVTIPPKVISKAVGLAIFTTLRAGFQVSGATGSGILIARLPDGSWSPPSGIQLHSVGGGFQIGLDIYDCVCVINNREALAAFTNTRVSLGSDLAVVAGPYGAGAAVEFGTSLDPRGSSSRGNSRPSSPHGGDSHAQQQQQSQQNLQPNDSADKKSHRRSLSASAVKPVFSYVKSRGFYAGIRIDGTVVAERKDANAAFYGHSVSVDQILKGQVPPQGPPGMWPAGAQTLFGVLKGAEAGALQTSSHEHEQRPTSPGHHQQQPPPASPSHFQQGQGHGQSQGRPAREQSYTDAPNPPSYAESGPRPIDGDIKYA